MKQENPSSSPTFGLAAAVNDHATLNACLKRSPDVVSGALNLAIYEGFQNAGAAYQEAQNNSEATYLILAHQDVYLPSGFLDNLRSQISTLEMIDDRWAVAGVIGIDKQGMIHGQTWSSGLGRIVGRQIHRPISIETLDELLLVIKLSRGVQFSTTLPSFHFYGTDIVQSSKLNGMRSYVLDLPVIHHSRSISSLGDPGYIGAYRYMQRKWKTKLPLVNLVFPVYRSILPLKIRNLRMKIRARGDERRRNPEGDPVSIARRIGFERRPATWAGD